MNSGTLHAEFYNLASTIAAPLNPGVHGRERHRDGEH